MLDKAQECRTRHKLLLLLLPLLPSVLVVYLVNFEHFRPSLPGITIANSAKRKPEGKSLPGTSATTDDSANRKPEGERPSLVLLVGPPKTGTTTIQNTLGDKNSEELLRADHYKYIGNQNGVLRTSRSYHCEGEEVPGCKRSLSQELLDLLRRNGKKENGAGESNDNDNDSFNLIGASEHLGMIEDSYRQAWVDATTGTAETDITTMNSSWDVRILVNYRRQFELLPSRYNQDYKLTRIEEAPKVFGHHDWPGINGNIRVPTFPEHLQNDVDIQLHPTVEIYDAWSQDFPASLFHFHQEGDLDTSFVCQSIPDATELCQQLTNKNVTIGTRNKSTPFLDYDIIAVHAFEIGLVHESDNRYELSLAIQKEHKKRKKKLLAKGKEDDLPLVCPSENDLKKLYEASLKFEKWALETMGVATAVEATTTTTERAQGPQIRTEDFHANWEETLRSKKLCSVDAPKALEQPWLKQFLRSRHSKQGTHVAK